MRNFRQNRGVFSLFMLIGLAVIVACHHAFMELLDSLHHRLDNYQLLASSWTFRPHPLIIRWFPWSRIHETSRKTRTFTPFMGESQKYVSGRTPELYPSTI